MVHMPMKTKPLRLPIECPLVNHRERGARTQFKVNISCPNWWSSEPIQYPSIENIDGQTIPNSDGYAWIEMRNDRTFP